MGSAQCRVTRHTLLRQLGHHGHHHSHLGHQHGHHHNYHHGHHGHHHCHHGHHHSHHRGHYGHHHSHHHNIMVIIMVIVIVIMVINIMVLLMGSAQCRVTRHTLRQLEFFVTKFFWTYPSQKNWTESPGTHSNNWASPFSPSCLLMMIMISRG